MAIYPNNGSGRFGAPVSTSVTGFSSFMDANGDGKNDLVDSITLHIRLDI